MSRTPCVLKQGSPVRRYARSRRKFQCAANSARCFRNFCFTGYSKIINNTARTVLVKLKIWLLSIQFWLFFICLVAESIQQEMNETAFRYFQHIRLFASRSHVYECSGCSPMQANACCESKQTTICENKGKRSLSFPDLY